MLLFPIGGVSPLLGLEPVLFRERVHRLTVYTLFEDTSSMVGRILKGLKETGVLREAPANGTSARKRHRPRGTQAQGIHAPGARTWSSLKPSMSG